MSANHDSQIKNDIRARELLQAWFNQYGINPELHVWAGEDRASIASDAATMYPAAALVINQHGTQVCDVDDTGSINDAIYGEYEHFCEVAEREIAEATRDSIDINDGTQRTSWLHTWEGKDGYYFCYSGESKDGMSSESGDVGPFESRNEAIDYAQVSEND